MNHTTLAASLRRLFAGGLVLAASPLLAQDAPPPLPATAPMQRVEITGSSIRRLAAQTSLPITTMRAADFAKQGLATAQEVLNAIPMNQSSEVGASAVGAGTGGRSTADLRGLGGDKTLVLLNGRRLANHPYFADSVDLNIIPIAALERVEVLRDGASAIYGTDAIGGVINFITKRSVQGAAITFEGYEPWANGGGNEQRLNLSGGWGELERDGLSLWGVLDWHQQSPLRATERSFSQTGIRPERGMFEVSGTTFPANFFSDLGVSGNPLYPACQPPASVPLPDDPLCAFDYTRFVDNIPRTRQFSAMAKLNKKFGSHIGSLEFVHGRSTNTSQVAPPPLSGIGVIMTADSRYYPGNGVVPAFPGLTGEPLDVSWRPLETGPRKSFDASITDRLLASLEGTLAGWDYNTAISYSLGKAKSRFTGGYVIDQRIIDGVGSGILNPFGIQDAAGAQYLQDSLLLGEYLHARIHSAAIDARASRDLLTLPGGPLGFAIGAEFRRDRAKYFVDRALAGQASSSGYADASDQAGARSIGALFSEVNVPLIKDLELNFAARYDHYSDVGGSFNPKVALRWQPSKQVLVRASFNKGFRAPTLFDLYGPQATTNSSDTYDDPLLCPGGVPAPGANPNIACGQQQFVRQGGNPDLSPERSRTYSAGLVVEPLANLTLSVDYWNIRLKDQLNALAEQTLFGNFEKYRDLFVYDAAGTSLLYVLAITDNLGEVKTRGLDLSLAYRMPKTRFGNFSVNLDSTYVNKYDYQNEPGGPFTENAGRYADASPVFRWRHNLLFSLSRGDWSFNLANRYMSHYTDQNTAVAPEFFNKVGHYSTWSLSTTYSGNKKAEFTAGIKNLFDKEPPFTNQLTNFQLGYDPRYTDPLGFTVYARVTYKFN
ncbi:TonB-dependent receptor [Massilia yuzhufengensis]|uniref:Iron complex outermembrane recepter protein n=1 Tax=Massilia yuzhufengensis TaxID=1164594 RepID=A0A1I1G4W0_9BURK|nr:TonB-dependent receptor [Massilia yuzhufengensis]SFC04333.1 iron complex outermembrane recepter protein [Massilia yuzhufengensis]